MNISSFFSSKYAVPILLLIVSAYLYGGLFTTYPLFTHETPHLYYRIFEYYAELSANGFPATLFPHVLQEGGFAFPLYYPPLSYLIATLASVICGNFILGVHFAFFLSIYFSALAVYCCFRGSFGKNAATICAIAYVAFPYRFVEIFVRGALAESWSFFWFPLVFAGGLAVMQRAWYGVVLLAVSLAGLLITHSVVGMYFLAAAASYFFVICIFQKRVSAGLPAGFAFVLAVGLMSFYFVPQQMSWNLVSATDPSHMIATPELAAEQRPDWAQLFFTNPAIWNDQTIRATYPGVVKDGMSFELGFPYFLIISFAFVTGTARSLKMPLRRQLFWVALGLLVLLTIYMGAPLAFLKALPSQFSFIQFPWRVLGLTCFFSLIVLGVSIEALSIDPKHKDVLVLALSLLLVATVNPIYKVPVYEPTASDVVDKDTVIVEGNGGLVPNSEFLPRDYSSANLVQLARREIVSTGALEITDVHRTERRISFVTSGQRASDVVLPLISYPVWRAQLSTGEKLHLQSEEGLIKLSVPPGTHKVELYRVRAPGQKAGLLISACTLIGIIALGAVAYRRRPRNPH